MRYMCLIYFDEAKQDAMSAEAGEPLKHACLDGDERLRRAGRFIAASPLPVRVVRGKCLVTDGPFAETKEQLGGFIIIEAADIDEAIAIAAEIPVGWLARLCRGAAAAGKLAADGGSDERVGAGLRALPRDRGLRAPCAARRPVRGVVPMPARGGWLPSGLTAIYSFTR